MYSMLVAFDITLLVLAVARVTRFFTSDSLGEWWVRDPAERWADENKQYVSSRGNVDLYRPGWRGKLVSGITCPFCIGFWVGLAGIISLEAAGGAGNADYWWRIAAGAFALNYIVGHVSARID